MKRLLNLIKSKPNLDYLLICIIGLHSLFWLKGSLLYIGGDYGIPLNPLKNLEHLFTWKTQLGGVESWNLTLFFQYFIFALLKFLKLNLAQSQRVYIYIMHSLSGISMYYLISGFKDSKRMARLIASLFYMFNPFMLGMVLIPAFIPYHLAPLVIGFYIRGIFFSSHKFKYSLLTVLGFLLMIGDLPNYKHIFVPLLIIFSFTIFNTILRKDEKTYPLKFFGTFIFIFIMLTLWFTLPYISLLSQSSIGEFISRHGIDFGDYGYAHVASLFRLLGSGSFQMGGLPCGPIYFNNFFIILFGYLITVLVFSAILLRSKSKEVIFFALMAVVFMFLAKGTNPPFGEAYKYIVLKFPIMRVFRTSWSLLFGAAIAYSFLLGVTTESIYLKLNKKTKSKSLLLSKGLVIAIISLILINGWPFLTGANLQNIHNPPSYQGVTIPAPYFQAEQYLTKIDEDSRFLKIPASDGGYIYTNWHYGGSNLIPSIFSKPYIDGYYLNNTSQPILKFIYESIEENKFDNLYKVLGLLNIRYIVIDGFDKLSTDKKLENYLKSFNTERELSLEKNFGQIYIYRNNFLIPHIYGASRAILAFSDINTLIPRSYFDYINDNTVFLFRKLPDGDSPKFQDTEGIDDRILSKIDKIVFPKNSLDDFAKVRLEKELYNVRIPDGKAPLKGPEFKSKLAPNRDNVPKGLPKVQFRKVNPTEYRVIIKAKEPFWLVFSETFHYSWKAYAKNTSRNKFGTRVPLNEHFLVNGFANGWYIDMDKMKKALGDFNEYEVIIYYLPQKLFIIGLSISSLFLFLSSFLHFKRRIRDKR